MTDTVRGKVATGDQRPSIFESDPEAREIACRYAGKDFDKPQIVSIEVWDAWGGEEWSLQEFRDLLSDAINTIPMEFRDETKVSLGGDDTAYFSIWYEGLEDEKTVFERMKRCEEYVKKHREKYREAEKREWNRLKAKFGAS